MSKQTTEKLTVRERLQRLSAHIAGLRTQAATVGSDDDPIKGAQALASIANELSAAAIIEGQLRSQLTEDERQIQAQQQAALDAKVLAIRPREREAFLQVASTMLELERALNDLAGVNFELSALQSAPVAPPTSPLAAAIAMLRQSWPLFVHGRSALGMEPEPDDKARRIAEAEADIARFTRLLADAKANRLNYTNADSDRQRNIRRCEYAIKTARRDIDVANGKEWFAIPDPEVRNNE